MNIEELDILKELSEQTYFGDLLFSYYADLIGKLLTAYEKEKEKNKKINKYIEDRAKIGKDIQTFINKDYVEQEYISKDKIKAKIEEVEKWELYNMKIPKLSTLDERLGAKIGIKYVLQSLLEKE